jgi:sialic acid synthase SpsE
MLYQQMNQSLKEAKTLIEQAKETKAEIKRLEDRFDDILVKRKRKKDETRKGHKEAQASVHQDA